MATRIELTVSEVAALAGCSRRVVIRALLTWRLRGRRVGREALIWEEDAKAFAAYRLKRSR